VACSEEFFAVGVKMLPNNNEMASSFLQQIFTSSGQHSWDGTQVQQNKVDAIITSKQHRNIENERCSLVVLLSA
jgi:ABC-type oligopeptide transport system substrate-binding subunit